MNKTLSEKDNHGFVGLRQAVAEMMNRISAVLPDLEEPIKMIVVGGVAVNFYTGLRVTMDVDAAFSQRIVLPEDLIVPYEGPDGKLLSIHFDRSYNPTFAVLHEDHEADAFLVKGAEFENARIELRVLSPVDLAVSKIARYQGPDAEDIAALAKQKLIFAETVSERAEQALSYYLGNIERVKGNLRTSLKLIEDVQRGL